VAQVYEEIRADFALLRDPRGNSPFMAHSPDPELLAGVWSTLYETVLVEQAVARADKEAIAAAVSRSNDCPFCVQAHALLSGVAGERRDGEALVEGEPDGIADPRRRELVRWARATRDPSHALIRDPPFAANEAPEVIGTALGFHYVNRVVEVFQGHAPLSMGPRGLRRASSLLVGVVARRAMRRGREPGRTLQLLPEAELPPELAWALPSANIADAIARFIAVADRAGELALSAPVRERVHACLAVWDGADPPLDAAWLEEATEGFDEGARAQARLALLSALAPHRVDDGAGGCIQTRAARGSRPRRRRRVVGSRRGAADSHVAHALSCAL
jgi:AhpD family alkylhydroperoxidase